MHVADSSLIHQFQVCKRAHTCEYVLHVRLGMCVYMCTCTQIHVCVYVQLCIKLELQ